MADRVPQSFGLKADNTQLCTGTETPGQGWREYNTVNIMEDGEGSTNVQRMDFCEMPNLESAAQYHRTLPCSAVFAALSREAPRTSTSVTNAGIHRHKYRAI